MAFQRKLVTLVSMMHTDVVKRITEAYVPPKIAQDSLVSALLEAVIVKIFKDWLKKFNTLAPVIAEHFTKSIVERSDSAFDAALRKAGFAIDFKMTPAMKEAIDATIAEQVSLIRSIPQQYLTQVEGMVMRSIIAGHDIGTLTNELTKQFLITRKRAAFIAMDQNNKASATFTRVRQLGMGITEGEWLHSGGGKHPRPEHVKWTGKRYDIKQGMWSEVDQMFVWPRTRPNCRCVSKSVIRGHV